MSISRASAPLVSLNAHPLRSELAQSAALGMGS
jgi:hypothetical protein